MTKVIRTKVMKVKILKAKVTNYHIPENLKVFQSQRFTALFSSQICIIYLAWWKGYHEAFPRGERVEIWYEILLMVIPIFFFSLTIFQLL